ncbi:MAG: dihydrofolate reductase family protein [Rhodobacterales bacterium]|nr:dihydrofolate reductase family protein [Rhodobacterales bacterium]
MHIRGMMACTLDGFVADTGGGVGFLDDFGTADWGFAEFLDQIGTAVMGRRTYDHLCALAPVWPYPGVAGLVLGRGLVPPMRGGAQVWAGDLAGLVAHLRSQPRDAWVVGGPSLQGALLALGALDRLELWVVPRMIGAGLRLFPDGLVPPGQPDLAGVRQGPMGMVCLDYRFGASGLGGRAR